MVSVLAAGCHAVAVTAAEMLLACVADGGAVQAMAEAGVALAALAACHRYSGPGGDFGGPGGGDGAGGGITSRAAVPQPMTPRTILDDTRCALTAAMASLIVRIRAEQLRTRAAGAGAAAAAATDGGGRYSSLDLEAWLPACLLALPESAFATVFERPRTRTPEVIWGAVEREIAVRGVFEHLAGYRRGVRRAVRRAESEAYVAALAFSCDFFFVCL
jgi:hypothetical protein